MTVRLVFSQEARPVFGNADVRSLDGWLVARGEHEDCALTLLNFVLVASEHAKAFIVVHMPQVGSDFLGHTNAVAEVVDASQRCQSRTAKIILDHLLVAFEATTGKDDA